MPKYEVEVTVTKEYVTNKMVRVFAKDEENAQDKAHEIASGWATGNADSVNVEIGDVLEV